jgi:hypothetical protein
MWLEVLVFYAFLFHVPFFFFPFFGTQFNNLKNWVVVGKRGIVAKKMQLYVFLKCVM